VYLVKPHRYGICVKCWMARVGFTLALCVPRAGSAEVEVHLTHGERALTGPWRFHFGDDPRWASASFDDHGWEQMDLTPKPGAHDGDVGLPGYVPGWSARGHAGQWGHAWYRLRLHWSVSEGSRPVLLGPTLGRSRRTSTKARFGYGKYCRFGVAVAEVDVPAGRVLLYSRCLPHLQ